MLQIICLANEGEFSFSAPTNTGTITLINSFGDVTETEPLGDIVHALEVYNDKAYAMGIYTSTAYIIDMSDNFFT